MRIRRGGHCVNGLKIIAVGNLSVGGTGKSVVVSLLVNMLGPKKCAVVLRGYKRRLGKKPLLLVSDGQRRFCDISESGDEPYMLAEQLNIPVVVCKNRLVACEYIANNFSNVQYVILDDAYQNHRVKKDVEILLLDAHAPFENGHCLPAGRLREKNYMRADIIFLTHAQGLSPEDIRHVKQNLLKNFDQQKILCTRHATTNILDENGVIHATNVLKGKRVVVVAGLGDPNFFIKKVGDLGAEICDVVIFQDHFDYQEQDIEKIAKQALLTCSQAIVTTEKDWVKIKMFKKKYHGAWYIPRVSIEFLSQEEYSFFELFLKKS